MLDTEPAHHLLPTEILTVLSHPDSLAVAPRSLLLIVNSTSVDEVAKVNRGKNRLGVDENEKG